MFPACLQVRHGAHAIFGPSDPHLGAHVQSVCDALEIPHLEVNTLLTFRTADCILKLGEMFKGSFGYGQ